MTYPYDETKFREHLEMLHHPKYNRDEAHQLRLELSWGGDYPGSSTAIVELLSPWEGKEELLRNTLGFITGNIRALYEETLRAMLPVFGSAGVGEETESGVVKTLADLHRARDEQDCIRFVFLKPDDVKEDIAVFSLLTQLRYEYHAPEDGCEFVFDHNKVIFWGGRQHGRTSLRLHLLSPGRDGVRVSPRVTIPVGNH